MTFLFFPLHETGNTVGVGFQGLALRHLREAAGLVTAMERITGGTYVQSLVADENDRRNSNIIPNGIRPGGGAIQ